MMQTCSQTDSLTAPALSCLLHSSPSEILLSWLKYMSVPVDNEVDDDAV